MNVAMMEQAEGVNRGLVRWLVAGAAAVALFIAVMLHSAPVGAAEPDGDLVFCNGAVTNYCPNLIGFQGNNYGYWGGYPYYLGGVYGNFYNGYVNNVTYGFRTYTDNRSNCPNGQVTQSGAGFYCTLTGTPAAAVNGNGFQYVNGYAGYPYTYGFGYAGYYPWWGGVRTGVPYTGVIRVAEVTAPVQVPAADPQPAPAAPAPAVAPVQAPAAPAVTQAAPAPQPAPAQMATSLSAAQQQPAAPVTAPVAVPTTGGANGTTVQGTSTAVVAAPQVAPGNDDHRG